MGRPVGLSDRLAAQLLGSRVPLEREDLERETLRLLPTEAPLAGPDAVAQVVDTLVGLGPIEHLLRRPGVSDVLVNRFDEIWIEREGRLERTDVAFPNEAAVVAAVERVIAPLGLRIDRASPAVDARLPDGSRLHALIPPATVDGPVVAVRRFTEVVASLDELVLGESIRPEGADLLRNAVRDRANVVVTGGTGSGKTSLLNLLSKEIPASERIVTVEDAAELRLSGHVVRLEARPANSEGAGRIDLETLVRHALRLRPDRLIVGEVRGPEGPRSLDHHSFVQSGVRKKRSPRWLSAVGSGASHGREREPGHPKDQEQWPSLVHSSSSVVDERYRPVSIAVARDRTRSDYPASKLRSGVGGGVMPLVPRRAMPRRGRWCHHQLRRAMPRRLARSWLPLGW